MYCFLQWVSIAQLCQVQYCFRLFICPLDICLWCVIVTELVIKQSGWIITQELRFLIPEILVPSIGHSALGV